MRRAQEQFRELKTNSGLSDSAHHNAGGGAGERYRDRSDGAAGQPFDEDTRGGIERYRADHQRGRLGRIDYRLDALGLDAQELRKALAFYSERFGVPDA